MGMFQPQNYGQNFNESMIGMGNFINGMNKTEDDRAQRLVENGRAERALAAQEASSKASVEHSEAQTAKMKREEEAAALLQQSTPVYAKVAAPGGELADEDLPVLAKMQVQVPYLPNNLEDTKKYREAHSILIDANKKAMAMPGADGAFKAQYGDSPETDKVIDAANVVLSKDRHKSHIDTDGSITGIPGAGYSTERVHAFAGMSTEGGAKTALFFSVVDGNGNPIYQKDAQGQDTDQRKLVPETVNQSNNPQDRLDFKPAEARIMKSELALQQLDAVQKLTPEQRTKLKKEMETAMYGLMPGGVEKMLAANQKDTKPFALADGGMLVTPDGRVLAENAKTTNDIAKTVTVGVGNGMEQTFQYNPQSKKFDLPVGKPTAKHAPKDGGPGGKLPAEAQLVEYYKKVLGTSYEDAIELAKTGKAKPIEMATKIYADLKSKDMNGTPDQELRQQAADAADFFINKYTAIPNNGSKPRFAPDSQGFTPDGSMASHGSGVRVPVVQSGMRAGKSAGQTRGSQVQPGAKQIDLNKFLRNPKP